MSRRGKMPVAPAEVLLHRDLSTSQQINMLLPICHTMMGYLLNPERDHENIPGKKIASGEAFIAAENTFRIACERLDQILGEATRWGVDYQLKLEHQYNERHAQQLSTLKAQQEAAEQQRVSSAEVVAPHFRYKPYLIPLEDGKWAAFLGDLKDLDSGILGIGDHPASALQSFDDVFKGSMSKAVVEWLAQHEKNLESGLKTTLPFPKDENSKELDKSRTGTPETPPFGGPQYSGDSESPNP